MSIHLISHNYPIYLLQILPKEQIYFHYGKFKLANQKNIEKATKTMYEVIRRGKRHNISIECLLDLFDKIVKPILLYGCEVWGFSDNYVIEKNHLKFCKLILHLKQRTPNFMIYGELNLNFPFFVKVTPK
jgi:hypothetical protein